MHITRRIRPLSPYPFCVDLFDGANIANIELDSPIKAIKAIGQDGRFATLCKDGVVSFWSQHGELLGQIEDQDCIGFKIFPTGVATLSQNGRTAFWEIPETRTSQVRQKNSRDIPFKENTAFRI